MAILLCFCITKQQPQSGYPVLSKIVSQGGGHAGTGRGARQPGPGMQPIRCYCSASARRDTIKGGAVLKRGAVLAIFMLIAMRLL